MRKMIDFVSLQDTTVYLDFRARRITPGDHKYSGVPSNGVPFRDITVLTPGEPELSYISCSKMKSWAGYSMKTLLATVRIIQAYFFPLLHDIQ